MQCVNKVAEYIEYATLYLTRPSNYLTIQYQPRLIDLTAIVCSYDMSLK